MAAHESPTDRNAVTGGAIAVWLATGLGVGRIPVAPGTFASLAALPLVWGIGLLGRLDLVILATLAICLVGVPIIHAAVPRLGRGHDPGCIVWDEIAGMAITFLGVPITGLVSAILGFALFRLFDVAKPPPVRHLERLPGGWGVMADDCAAGVFANVALRLILAAVPSTWL